MCISCRIIIVVNNLFIYTPDPSCQYCIELNELISTYQKFPSEFYLALISLFCDNGTIFYIYIYKSGFYVDRWDIKSGSEAFFIKRVLQCYIFFFVNGYEMVQTSRNHFWVKIYAMCFIVSMNPVQIIN